VSRRLSLECLEDRSLLSTIPLTVNTLADDPGGPVSGQTTLRDAITQADADTGNQYILNFCVTGTIDLSNALSDLSNNIEIDGPGASNLTVQRDPSAAPFSVFTVDSGTSVSISGMTISGGNAGSGGAGGGIDNSGTLTVSDSTFTYNSAGLRGGGIYNVGTLTVSSATFTDNSAPMGGGISSENELTVNDSTFTNNSCLGWGGAIDSEGFNYTTIVSNSVFIGNPSTEGGAIGNTVTLTVRSSVFSGNSSHDQGGAINNNSGMLSVSSSTFTDNSAYVGGGIFSAFNSLPVTVSNSVFTSNSALSGDAIYNVGGGR
jgi:predicted outer membrane repeat protein